MVNKSSSVLSVWLLHIFLYLWIVVSWFEILLQSGILNLQILCDKLHVLICTNNSIDGFLFEVADICKVTFTNTKFIVHLLLHLLYYTVTEKHLPHITRM